jgi:hypothetical protein
MSKLKWYRAEVRITVAVLRAALLASCLRGALPTDPHMRWIKNRWIGGKCYLPPVDLRAVCLVRAMSLEDGGDEGQDR